ncbi:MAG: hypothetical protein JW963_10735 [Anaerolineales bacterium]|nr:hypothetical protein [Anaerolineales bacterium]
MKARNPYQYLRCVSLLLALFLLFGCAQTSSNSQKGRGSLIVGVPAEPLSLDPASSGDGASGLVYDYMLEGLFGWDQKGALAPVLASSWNFSDDGTELTVQLRENVKFHDNSEFNAQAVKVTFDRILNPNLKLVGYAAFKDTVESVDVVEDNVVKFILKAPRPTFLYDLANSYARILSPKSLERSDEEINTNPIGTGPFKFVSWTPKQQIVVEAFNDYWGGLPNLEKITFKFIPEPASRIAALEAGDIDIAFSPPIQDVNRLASNSNFQVFVGPGAEAYHYEMNMLKEPFKDLRVRQALNYAIDKDSIVKKIYLGYAKPLNSPMAELIPGHVAVGNYQYDPDKARTLLADAGYSNGLELTLWVPNGRYLMERELSDAVAGYLSDIGIEVKIVSMDYATYLDRLRNPTPGEIPDYDLALWNAQPGSGEPNMIWKLFVDSNSWPPNYVNIAYYANPEVDTLIQDAQVTLDEGKRNELHAKIQEIVWNDAPWIFVVSPNQLAVGTTKIKDVYYTQFLISLKDATIEP